MMVKKMTEPQFEYEITRTLYNKAKEKTDCPLCLVDDCNELDRLLTKIYSHEEKTHRCIV